MKKYLDLISKSEGVVHSLATVLGSIVSTSISAVALIILSRFLGPVKFGQFSIGFSLAMIVIKANDLGLNVTISKFVGGENKQKKISQTVGLIFSIKALLALISILLSLIFGWSLIKLLNFPSPLLVFTALILALLTAFYEQMVVLFQAMKKIFTAISLGIIQSLFKLAVVVGVILLQYKNITTIFIFYFISPLLAVIATWSQLPKWLNIHFQNPLSKLNSPIFSMVKHTGIAFVATGIIENVDLLFVQRFATSWETGLYAGASRIALFVVLAGQALGGVLNARVANYHSLNDLKQYFRKAWLLSLVSLFPIILLSFPAIRSIIINLSIGSDYLPASKLLLILFTSSITYFATIPLISLFYSFKANWYFSFTGIAQILIVILGNFLLIPFFGFTIAAYIRLTARIVVLLFTLILSMFLLSSKKQCKQ